MNNLPPDGAEVGFLWALMCFDGYTTYLGVQIEASRRDSNDTYFYSCSIEIKEANLRRTRKMIFPGYDMKEYTSF